MNKRDVDFLAIALRSSRPLLGGSVTKRTILAEQWERDVQEVSRTVEQLHPEMESYTFCEMCGLFVRR